MAKKIEVYVDTSAFIAFLDKSDSYHSLFEGLFSNPPVLATTALVINEGHAWFLRRYDQMRALQFLSFIEKLNPLQIISVGLTEINASTKIIRKYSDQALTMADAVGLAFMHERKIKNCWSTDRHLSLMGARLAIYQ